MKAHKTLTKAGVECKLIPVPRHLSSDCGICIESENELEPYLEDMEYTKGN